MINDIRLVQGDTYSSLITVIENGSPLDITGATFSFTAKRKLSDADDDAIISKDWSTHTAPTEGKTLLTLTDDQTDVEEGTYYFDIQFKLGGTVATILIGKLFIIAQVTRR